MRRSPPYGRNRQASGYGRAAGCRDRTPEPPGKDLARCISALQVMPTEGRAPLVLNEAETVFNEFGRARAIDGAIGGQLRREPEFSPFGIPKGPPAAELAPSTPLPTVRKSGHHSDSRPKPGRKTLNETTPLKLVAPATENRTVTPRRRPNAAYRTREHLTEAEIEKLIKAAGNNRWGHRDATMILVAYRHGLRASGTRRTCAGTKSTSLGHAARPPGQARHAEHPPNPR